MDTKLKKDFPLLASSDLIYFDNAATTHKPSQVIDAVSNFYSKDYAAVHRGIYTLSEHATILFEKVRTTIAQFLGAHSDEIIFTQGTTHGINFIATAWALKTLKTGDEIVLTELEHHANLIPWQQVSLQTGALIKYIPINPDGTLNLDNLSELITERTKLVSVIHSSNALGTLNPIELIRNAAHKVGARILIDAAQSVPHQKINLKSLNVDFLVFSGHKLLGPTGIGVLYIKRSVQHEVPPYQFGGGMVFHADYYQATWLKAPCRYEAGTPPTAQVIGLGAAIDYLNATINFEDLKRHEAQLCARVIKGLQEIPDIRILGPLNQLQQEGHLVSFVHNRHHHHDVGAFLDNHAIAVRTGHYCSQPLAQKLGIDGSIRISFYCYNTLEEVDYFLDCLKKL